MREPLTDNLGKIIGYIGKIGKETHIYDEMGRWLGKHNPSTDYVVDNMGRAIGKGIQLLATLLKR